jgi:hypothetical protein
MCGRPFPIKGLSRTAGGADVISSWEARDDTRLRPQPRTGGLTGASKTLNGWLAARRRLPVRI